MKIVFATNNLHKLEEIRQILGDSFEVLSLGDIGCHEDIPETADTLEGNAMEKASYVKEHYGYDCFADDTGLEVDALGGEPGVYSARYAGGEGHDSEANMRKLLAKLSNENNRKARFRTIIALINDQTQLFEGIVEGAITTEKHGEEGFGYDPVFQPEGYDKTFAELGADVKNTISHRARAVKKLADYLKQTLTALLFFIIFGATSAQAQGIGTWNCYWAYNNITEIQPAGNKVFVLSSKGLFSYNVNDQSVETYDKMNVLNDCNIAHIRYSKQAKRLLIAYENQNIDLFDLDGNVVNISDLYKKSMTEDKTINHIYINGSNAYCSTNFGVMNVNMKDAEIANTYQLGFAVNYTYIEGKYIYAASKSNGIYRALLTDNLLDKSNWSYAMAYKALQENLRLVEDEVNNCFWTANEEQQLTAYRVADNQQITTVMGVKPDGPAYNYFGYMKFSNGRLYSCGGGYAPLVELWRKPAVQIYADGEWTLVEEDIEKTIGHRYIDAVVLDHEPGNPDHIFVGGRTGLFEFNNGRFVKHYTTDNSPLESAIADGNKDYVLVEGLTFDSEGNLWVAISQAPSVPLACLQKDGTWRTVKRHEFMYESYTLPAMKSLMFDSRGLLWFANAHWQRPSFYAFDTKSEALNSYTSFVNEDGLHLAVQSVNNLTEDRNGNIWVQTNLAPLVLLENDIYEGSNATLQQIKVPRNDGTNFADYLLDGVGVACMAIDGGGRKWIGTSENGVYLISEDNMEQVYHFLPSNSKLLSETIESIAINNETGEVFIGTDKGLCSFMSDATTPSESMDGDNVYAYPNPVTPDYTGLITVTGLSFDADVKITTSNGVLVAQGRSNGGSFTWDGTDTKGRPVASGVYMVQTATSDGKKGTVCKIAIVR